LATENSDFDKVGVFVAPTREVLGLGGAAMCENSMVTHEPDLTLHELSKFCRLGLKSNPTTLELLWLSDYEICDEVGVGLRSIRDHFPCTDAVRGSWGGFCSQLAKNVRGYALRAPSELNTLHMEKSARHCWRLLSQGHRFLTTGELRVNVGDCRDEIFSMGKLATTDVDTFLELVKGGLNTLETCRSVLPEKPGVRQVNKFLVKTRLAGL
jgi:hypothetical protein